MSSLEERVRKLEDIEAIRLLKVRYAQACDDNYNADRIAEMYMEDGVFEAGETVGVWSGRETIRQQFANVSQSWTFALHYMLGHAIEIDSSGDEATGTWYLWQPGTIDGRPVWVAATYNDRYRKVGGQWYFSHVKLDLAFLTPYESGWVKEKIMGS